MSSKATRKSSRSSKRAKHNTNTTPASTTMNLNNNNNEHTPVDGEILSYTVPSSLTIPSIPGLMYGSSPSGTMQIILSNQNFPGLPSATASNTTTNNSGSYKPTIQLLYDIPDGVQSMHYHKNPGVSYAGTNRMAFLPNTDAGCRLLSRMKVAFLHGHIFSVGRSITNGRDNQTTWSLQVPSKTSLQGGPFGFPDPNYIPVANLSLDTIGIPDADACSQFLQGLSSSNTNNTSISSAAAATTSVAGLVNQLTSLVSNGVALPSLPSSRRSRKEERINYTAPTTLASSFSMKNVFHALTSAELKEAQESEQECPLCLERICDCSQGKRMSAKKDAITICKIGKCGHIFHRECIDEAVEHHPKCPVCRVPLGEPQGKSPSGSMHIRLDVSQPCPGFNDAQGTYIMTYSMPSGTQESYHENPGQQYSGASRTAYLPNNDDGRKLLRRLKYAWKHGLTFRVGTSLTTGMHNQVTWTSIHHKTGLSFGSNPDPHSFPDDNYMMNVNESLDALHVPPHDQCE